MKTISDLLLPLLILLLLLAAGWKGLDALEGFIAGSPAGHGGGGAGAAQSGRDALRHRPDAGIGPAGAFVPCLRSGP